MKPFEMSIETTEGNSFKNGFHLGTDESLARAIVMERYAARVNAGVPTVTIALMRDGRIVDVWMGDRWAND